MSACATKAGVSARTQTAMHRDTDTQDGGRRKRLLVNLVLQEAQRPPPAPPCPPKVCTAHVGSGKAPRSPAGSTRGFLPQICLSKHFFKTTALRRLIVLVTAVSVQDAAFAGTGD